MYCKKCGKKNTDTAYFCKSCGSEIKQKSNSIKSNDNDNFLIITPLKLALLSITTFGIYVTYWFYRQFKAIKNIKELKMFPLLRALFAGFFAYGLFNNIQTLSKNNIKSYSSGWLAFIFFVLLSLFKLPDAWWLISLLNFLPLIIVQKYINNNLISNYNEDQSGKFNGWEICILIFGGIFVLMAVYGTFIPE